MIQHKAFLVTADVISAAAIAGSMMQWLPPIAALGGVIWYAIQIWESKTVQKWARVHRARARVRFAALKSLEAEIARANAQEAVNAAENEPHS